MKFTSKLTAALILIALISSLFSLYFLYKEARHELFYEIRSKALSIAATTASLLDGDLVSEIQSDNSPQVKFVQKLLDQARLANRRNDVSVKSIFIIKASDKLGMAEMILDTTKNPSKKISMGTLLTDKELGGVLSHMHDYYAAKTFASDKEGKWLNGYAPIYNRAGKYVATLGISLSAFNIDDQLNSMVSLSFLAFIISLLLTVILAFLLRKHLTKSLFDLKSCLNEVGSGHFQHTCKINSEDEFQEMSDFINQMAKKLYERELMRQNISRIMSKGLYEKVMQNRSKEIEMQKRTITLLICDIKDFLQLEGNLDANTLLEMTSEYFNNVIEIIYKYGGSIDKLLGDGLIIQFNAPQEDQMHADHAVQCALALQDEMRLLHNHWTALGKPSIHVGIGIHSGEALVEKGYINPCGETLDIAFEIEKLTRKYNKNILISSATWHLLHKDFKAKKLDPLHFENTSIELYLIESEE